jgi:tetratricopeptide (TPR) repeat protein
MARILLSSPYRVAGHAIFFLTRFRKQHPLKWRALPLFITSLLLLSGCASGPQTQQLLRDHAGLPSQHELTNTPFFPQQRYQCGPAALATVLQQAGVDISPDALIEEIYLPSRHGALQLEILASTRRHARLPYPIAPNMTALLTEVSAGNPVLVLQNLALDLAPQWHYAVVVGFDLEKGEVILRSGLQARHHTAMQTFELTWARSQYWGIVITEEDKLPATASAEQYLNAIIHLENTRIADRGLQANRAYRTAIKRWPNHFILQMGLGNNAYQLTALAEAVVAFRAALKIRPHSGAAHNNLALLLLKQKQFSEAEKHSRRAVALGGRHLQDFVKTLDEIQQARKE